MSNRFVISDHHFGHANTFALFKNNDGTPLRPFTSVEEMNGTMIKNHNAVVNDNDTVYFLGDVVINKKFLPLIHMMKGKKRLVRGNHDIFEDKMYRDVGFKSIYGVRVFTDEFILSHIPLHPDCVTDRFKYNVHGHLHGNRIMKNGRIDPKYFSVCVEQINYTPISFDELKLKFKEQDK